MFQMDHGWEWRCEGGGPRGAPRGSDGMDKGRVLAETSGGNTVQGLGPMRRSLGFTLEAAWEPSGNFRQRGDLVTSLFKCHPGSTVWVDLKGTKQSEGPLSRLFLS